MAPIYELGDDWPFPVLSTCFQAQAARIRLWGYLSQSHQPSQATAYYYFFHRNVFFSLFRMKTTIIVPGAYERSLLSTSCKINRKTRDLSSGWRSLVVSGEEWRLSATLTVSFVRRCWVARRFYPSSGSPAIGRRQDGSAPGTGFYETR